MRLHQNRIGFNIWKGNWFLRLFEFLYQILSHLMVLKDLLIQQYYYHQFAHYIIIQQIILALLLVQWKYYQQIIVILQ